MVKRKAYRYYHPSDKETLVVEFNHHGSGIIWYEGL
jgi:hypothetical protein